MIINNISKLRKEGGITQEKLANDLNVSRQTIVALEDPSNKYNVSLELAFKIKNYFNKSLEDIFMEINLNNSANTIEEIQQIYGKHTIIIKDTLVFRCSTRELEQGSNNLLNFELPKYGQMKKFIIINDNVYELIPQREYNNRNDIVKHTIGNKVDINPNCIDFTKKTWQEKKKTN